MEINLEKALDASKELIYGMHFFNGFKDYASIYFVTSECIKDYLQVTDFDKGRALTILSGGDQVFNLIASGVYKIDAFDINKLTYFVYHLRKAMINTYNHQDFKKTNIIFTSGYSDSNVRLDIIRKVKAHLPEEVYEYYRKMLEFSNGNPMVNFESLYYKASESDFTRNNYLESEEEYKRLQNVINDAEVSITFADALSLPKDLSTTYDIILLSNIADYFPKDFSPEDFRKFITSYMEVLNPNGALINYLYRINEISPFKNIPITKEDIGVDKIHPVCNPIFKADGEGFYLEHKPKQYIITK